MGFIIKLHDSNTRSNILYYTKTDSFDKRIFYALNFSSKSKLIEKVKSMKKDKPYYFDGKLIEIGEIV